MDYKNKKGLTLVEVLVSVVLTILVMMYGLTIFISAWRLDVDSASYALVVSEISRRIEDLKSKKYNSTTNLSSTSIFKLSNGVNVKIINDVKPEVSSFPNSRVVTITAEWPVTDSGASMNDNNISKKITTWKRESIVFKYTLLNMNNAVAGNDVVAGGTIKWIVS